MTGQAYNSTNVGTAIGPTLNRFTITGGLFGQLVLTGSQTCTVTEVNTSSLTPAGPYSNSTNRSIGVRLFTSSGQRFQLLSLTIGYS